jgi:hypothetical protein
MPAVTSPPGELIYSVISFWASCDSREQQLGTQHGCGVLTYRTLQHDYPVPEQPTENVVGSFALGCLFYHYWCKWHSVIIHYKPDQVNLDVCDDEHGAEKTQENPGVHAIPFYAVITGFTHVRPARALCTCDRPPRWWSGWPSRVCVGLAHA